MGVETSGIVILGFQFNNEAEFDEFCKKYEIDQDSEEMGDYYVYCGPLNAWTGDDFVYGIYFRETTSIDNLNNAIYHMKTKFPDVEVEFIITEEVY